VTLREKIEQQIRGHGPIPFSRYMELCLYHPELGYYSRNAEQFGKAGDFYTSSDVHAVFGRLLARQFEEMWRELGSPDQIEIRELGPGRGLFAQDVLDWSEKKFPEFFGAVHYALEENSPTLRQRLQATLNRHFETKKASLTTLPQGLKPSQFEAREGTAKAVPSLGGSRVSDSHQTPIIIFANEFFDALPVEILSSRGELHIAVQDGRFIETWEPGSPEELEFLDRYGIHPEDRERVEVPLIAQSYMSKVAATLNRGFMVVIDYGYTQAEQLAGRHRGTLTVFRQHSVSADPYEAPGEQDVTAHVNFTALAAAAQRKGVQTNPLLTQSQFLLGIGENNQFADAFEECRQPQERAKVALQLKHLVTPAGMGENFQVLIGSKGVDSEKAANLSGISFGKSTAIHTRLR
jgi:SAM-dependent MidA family methyltransferase